MKTYFINLDRSADRREWFLQQGERHGLQLVRVPAVDARDLDEAEQARWRALSSRRNSLSASEIACFLSHRRAWQKVLDDADEWALITEDDIHLSTDIGRFMQTSEWIPAGVDLIQAETNLKRQELSFAVSAKPFGHTIRRLKSFHFGSAGYFISRATARSLLEYTQRHCEPADAILFSPRDGVLRLLNVGQLTPALCLQDYLNSLCRFQSTIIPDRTEFHENDPLSAKVRGVRKLPREVMRLLSKVFAFCRGLYLMATRKSVFEKVAFGRNPRS